MAGVTPNLGLPYVQPSDAITDYPALDQARAGLLDVAGMVIIEDKLLAAPAASFDFTSIPQTFHHLHIVTVMRCDNAASGMEVRYRFNGDAGGNYAVQLLLVGGASASGFNGGDTAVSARMGMCTGAAAPAGSFGFGVAEIPNYRSTVANKCCYGFGSARVGGANPVSIEQGGCEWKNTAAINRITILPGLGNLVAGSRATLYGIGHGGGS